MRRLLISLGSGLIVVVAACAAMACETPVYRYAMYRWQPAPYEIYFFHDRPASGDDQRVQELLTDFERGSETRANVVYIPVNLADDPELASVPPDVKQAWDDRGDKQLPSYFISTPYGVGMSFAQLNETAVQSLVDSPARKSLGAQLETGKLGVFVMLNGKDVSENAASEAILAGLVGEVQRGEISLYVSPADVPADSEPGSAKPEFDVGFIKIDRDDDEEKWFVRSLLAMEPDLASEERPMVFLVYGRGRALLPYIGKGITRENLVREIEFISGACSCTVKEQNPGVDLLVRYDWESAAASLAERFGNEEGTESQFGPEMFFPELIIPETGVPAATELATTEVSEPVADPIIGPDAETKLDVVSDEKTPERVEKVESSARMVDPELASQVPGPAVATAPTATQPSSDRVDSSSPSGSGMMSVWIVGTGMGVALLILFGLTFVVLRPQ